MSRPRKDPSYRRHSSGQAVVTLTDGLGGRKDFLLGPHNSPESKQRYHVLLARWNAAGKTFRWGMSAAELPGLSVGEVILRFLEHAAVYYRKPSGRQTGEYQNFIRALRPLNHLFGATAAKDFNATSLKMVRQLMVEGYEHPEYGAQKALVRQSINGNVRRIKQVFRWASNEDLIPDSVWAGLLKVDGLKQGRSLAKEGREVRPIARQFVEATLPFCSPMVADMVRLQLTTGMRSGELVIMRGIDLDTTGKVWIYRPTEHKNEHRGHTREVCIGPEGQAIIRRYLRPDVHAFLFDAAVSRDLRFAEMRASRKTKVQPSQVCRRKAKGKRLPGRRYTTNTYARAIAYGIRKANEAGENIPAWHPHQLRHLRATELRKVGGLDLARAVLGHKSLAMADHYADIDREEAFAAMARIG